MKKIILSMFILLSSSMIYAQVNIGNILQYGVNDANVLAKPYLSPWGNMLGYSLNSGWYNSAKVHKLLGFDITVTGAYTMSPSSDAYFDINDYSDKLTSFELVDPTNSITPTVAGKSSDRPYLKPQNVPSNPVTDFAMPDGSEIDYLLTPMVTVGVGLPMGIELKGRFWPETKIGDAGKVGIWGLGVQKDIKDYIPGIKHVPVLNMSVLAAYTNLTGSTDVRTSLSDNSTLDIASSAFTTRLLIGANLPVIAFYAGVGYGKANSDFNVTGDYLIENGIETISVTDPIKVSYNNSNFDFNVGLRLRLGVIGLHADYSVGEYSSITAGFGINFR